MLSTGGIKFQKTMDRLKDMTREPGNKRPLLDQAWFLAALKHHGIKNIHRIEHDYNHCQIIIYVESEPPIQVPNATLYEWHLRYSPKSRPKPEERKKRLIKI